MTDSERDAARYRWIKAAPRLRIERMPDSHFWISADTGEKYCVSHSLSAFDTGFSGLPTLDHLVDQAMEMYPIKPSESIPPSGKEMELPLIDHVAEVISNGDDAHHFRDEAGEAILYVAAWLREEGFWQAANVLQSEVHDQLTKTVFQ